MSNRLLIHLPQARLARGETLLVPIVLVVEEPLKVRGIHARFWGAEETKAEYTTTSTDSDGRSTTTTHTAVEHTNVVDQQSVLAGGQPMGFFRGLGDSFATLLGGGRHEVLPAGEYPFEVEVTVPHGAPATHRGKKSRVFYELSAWVDVPLGFDLKANQAFELPPLPAAEESVQPVRVRYPDDAGRGFWDSLLAPDVRIELALAADAAREGDVVDGLIVIDTDRPQEVRALLASFMGIERTEARGHHDRIGYNSHALEIARPGMIQGRFSQQFSLPVELAGPPTIRGKLFSIEWHVQVTLDVPWAKNPQIRAPLRLIGRPAQT
jgi:hypothetical protein